MTPRRFATLIVALLLPALLWGMVEHGKNDLLLKTRSLMGQAKKDRPGLFDGFFMQYRLPEGDPEEQLAKLGRVWRVLQECTPESTRYGERTPVMADGGRKRERRQVAVRGRTRSGERVEFEVDWIRHAGNWYIHEVSGWEPTAQGSEQRKTGSLIRFLD